MAFISISVALQGSCRTVGGKVKMAISQRTRLEGDSGMSAREPHQGILGPTAMSARFHKIRQGERRPFLRTDSFFEL